MALSLTCFFRVKKIGDCEACDHSELESRAYGTESLFRVCLLMQLVLAELLEKAGDKAIEIAYKERGYGVRQIAERPSFHHATMAQG